MTQLIATAACGVFANCAYGQELGTTVPSLPPPSDTVLPRSGVDPTLPQTRTHLLDAYGETPEVGQGPPPPDLQILAQLGVSEEYIDNVGALTGGSRTAGSDFITAFQPVLTVIDTTQRVRINLSYHPIGEIYAEHGGFSQFDQEFNGDILVTLLPDWLYLDARGAVTEQSLFGGVGPAATVTLAPQDRETTSSFSVSPYLNHTFGGTGTLEAGVGYSYSDTSSPSTIPGYGSSSLSTERIFASFTTGQDYGRFRDRIGTDDSFYGGSGALSDAHRIEVTDDASYAVTRLVAVLGEVGYEDLDYPRAGYAYYGPIGAGGVQLTPGPHSVLTLEYRYLDGFGSVFAQGSVQATPRIRVFGGYSEGISTFQQDVQNSLLGEDVDATGAAASALVAAPLLTGSSFFGANENLVHLRRLNLSATYLGDRDTVTVSAQHETGDPVGHQVGLIPQLSTSGTFGNISERHELTPTLSLSVFAQYGSNRTGLVYSGSGDTVSVSVGLDKVFSETLSGYVRYGGSFVVGGSVFAAVGYEGLRGDENSVIIGAVKKF